MSWVAIILWIAIHIPDFIKIIEAIIELIKTLPKEERESYRLMVSSAIKTKNKQHVKRCLTACKYALEQPAA